MRVRIVAAWLLASAVMVGGCASQRGPRFKMGGRVLTLHTIPEGAQVTQFAPPTADRVDLGMTPLVNQPVLVLTELQGTVMGAGEMASLAAQMGMCKLRVEKPGYRPWEGNIATDPKQVVTRTITLERIPTPPEPATTSPATAPAARP